MATVSSTKPSEKSTLKASPAEPAASTENMKNALEKAKKEKNDQIFKDLAKLISKCINEN